VSREIPMNYRPRFSLVVLLALFASTSVYAGPGGGGGHSGGHSGGRGASGHSGGHASGHFFGHIFGHHSGGKDSQVAKTPDNRDDAALLTSAMAANRQRPHPAPAVFIPGLTPRFVSRPNRQFVSGFCGSFGFSRHTFLFPGDFNCFGDPFFFDSFFAGGFVAGYLGFNSFIAAGDLSAASGPMDFSPATDSAGESFESSTPAPAEDREMSPDAPVTSEAPVILLQLKDGSMYGLTRYWVEDGRLYYVTTYGGENSVPLDRIDIPKTVQLNADRNIPFVLPGAASLP
jgi:hypothetical protein